MFELSGKRALVTGASGGIGGAIAHALHAQGAAVALTGTRAPALEALAGELGERAHPLVCDLSDAEAVEALPGRAAEAMGGVDILVNNAGILAVNLLVRMKDAEWQRVLDIDLTAAMRLSRGVLRGMMKARWGRIISIGSVVGQMGDGGQTNYAAAKAGLMGFSKSLAIEVAGRNVTVNVVAPGYVQSPMTDGRDAGAEAEIARRVPMGRMARPDEVAAAVVFLAAEEAGYVTGTTLSVNGGLAMI